MRKMDSKKRLNAIETFRNTQFLKDSHPIRFLFFDREDKKKTNHSI